MVPSAHRIFPAWVLAAAFLCLAAFSDPLGGGTDAAIIQGIDTSVSARNDHVAAYTVIEHYSVFRNKDSSPAAEMTVKTTYDREQGKSYAILNESGSDLLRKQVLARVLDSERTMTQPANRATALINSANYTMNVKGPEQIEGRDCIALTITPRRNSPYLFKGTLWVDAHDYSIVKLAGIAAKSPSMLTGPTEVSRQYARIDGYPMAIRATAVSESWLLGRTTIEIEYTGYDIKFRQDN